VAKVKNKNMSIDDLEQLIEHKLLEILGDPDSGLHLNKEFKRKLEQRLKKPSKRITHKDVLQRFVCK
jgi:hypothetical protein